MKTLVTLGLLFFSLGFLYSAVAAEIGREVSVPDHLQDGDEFEISIRGPDCARRKAV